MKALTLTQPWATLVAIGAKRIETRGWKSDYRGPLAIHAAKGFPQAALELTWHEPFFTPLYAARYWTQGQVDPGWKPLPTGCVVATCELVECIRIPAERKLFHRHDLDYFNIGVWLPPEGDEFSFGDYTPGRWAWLLANVKPLAEPVPARGALSLWEWTAPASLLENIT